MTLGPPADSDALAGALATGRLLALLGFMGAGKSRVGDELSRLTGLPFVDLDTAVEEAVGRSVHQIFAERGEPYFRDRESEVLRALSASSGTILACGGGTLLREENRRLLRERAVRIWLRVSREEVLVRLRHPATPRRPLLEGRDLPTLIDGLWTEREQHYRDCDLAVETDGRTVGEIAREIARLLKLPWHADHRW